ncbi:Phosphotransferase enzyme family protein [Poriferisphaera corsica]|uniref:Phosphotransferase enzyme family protein n=1 Tax=Poriferisphaera corsica TaxID=2528020 RepID=A0A517YYM0_9BACT|nr:hypothetical protein [Poriferisphaera corsica]QDU35324.1 Phosphotransferase enzyme family protein [Poriferisphaera corsica]
MRSISRLGMKAEQTQGIVQRFLTAVKHRHEQRHAINPEGNALVNAICSMMQSIEKREQSFGRMREGMDESVTFDALIAKSGDPSSPDAVFGKLRWGGVFGYVGQQGQQVRRLAEMYDGRNGFVLERGVETIWGGRGFMGIGRKKGYSFIARKVHLIQPGEVTDRFTYCVQLTKAAQVEDGYVVTKYVPSFENIVYRLKHRFPDASKEDLSARARKFVDHVFPTFLTREAAFLKILAERLPEEYKDRVPKLLGIEKDHRGFVTKLHMNWMRTGSQHLSQIEFATQAADLLSALHDHAEVIHLDLRLDNIVVTDEGVGFVDFGSAVRIGEKIAESRMLTSLFSEMMRTSQIQRMLGKMIDDGHVTNEEMTAAHQKVDKAVDSYYLAVQINKPYGNPEFGHLIDFDAESEEAKALSALTAAILRPKHPDKTEFKSASDILRGIKRIEQRLNRSRSSRAA